MSDDYEPGSDHEIEAIEEIKRYLSDDWWRLCYLYKIKDPKGNAIPFTPNWAQNDYLENVHFFNAILKARQLGFSTLIDLIGLDRCVFFENQSFGIIAQGEKEASGLLDNCRFSYNNLPDYIREANQLIKDNTETMEFSNGSKIVAGISLRSGTYQILHVSEYGKTSAKFPDKAKEIKTGAFNTVHNGQQIHVESTAEGQAGEFFDLIKLARKIEDEGREMTPLDPKFHFYPWWKNPDYVLSTIDMLRTTIPDEMAKYFTELETDHGIKLTQHQKCWYVKKDELMGDEMMREFPSTADESFAASVAGSIYGKNMRILRKMKRITSVPWEPTVPVHTFWDFGNANYMAIWFFQKVNREWRMIRYHQDTSQDFIGYVAFMKEQPYSYGKHYVPHDGATVRLMETGNKTYKKVMEDLGLKNIIVVPVTKDKWKDIEFACKPALLKLWIDKENCADGIKCLDNYKKKQNKDGIWMKEPEHDEFSDGADAFRTFVMGYKEEAQKATSSFTMPIGVGAL